MAFTLVMVEVEDYDRWRAAFDGMEETRRGYGIHGGRVYQDVGNPNLITVIVEGDLSDLEAFAGSQVLKDAMIASGVVGPPQRSFVNEVT